MIALRDPPIKARCIIRSMKISGTHYRTIWPTAAGTIRVIDQSRLPFEFATIDLETLEDAALAIRSMVVRGAPLIGATAAYGMALALRTDASDARIEEAARVLEATRPTAFDLGSHGVPHTVIADNLGGHLMQRGQVDMVIVGSDRTTAAGDVCNKVGTYLKALAARDNGVPFYVALPGSTIDWSLEHGADIPIEERSPMELTHITGRTRSGAMETIRVVPEESRALNLAFDVTPARLVTALITERGICAATRADLRRLYPIGAQPN